MNKTKVTYEELVDLILDIAQYQSTVCRFEPDTLEKFEYIVEKLNEEEIQKEAENSLF